MTFAPLSRRRLVLLATTLFGSVLFTRAIEAGPDQGIGGTGSSFAPIDEDGDRGIGGTGVIGTIRAFGSIIVNDLRIAYPVNVAVAIDGQPASALALKIGQVVRVVAHRDQDGLSTQMIDVSSEVVGPVERVGAKSLTVLGQSVSTATLPSGRSIAVGDRVAVSGLRRTDGTIVASLIEPRADGPDKVAGPVTQGRDGGLRIGGLRVTGINGDLIGQRAVVYGAASSDGLFAVSRGVGEVALFPNDVKRLSVEAYVERRGDGLKLGSGLAVGGGMPTLPEGRATRAVLTTSIGADGRLDVESLRTGGTRYQATPKKGGALDRGPGGTRPMDFGHGPTATGERDAAGDSGLGGIGRGLGRGEPGLGAPGLGAPGLGAPGLGAPGLGAPGLGPPPGMRPGGRR